MIFSIDLIDSLLDSWSRWDSGSQSSIDLLDDLGQLVDRVDDEVRAALEQGLPGTSNLRFLDGDNITKQGLEWQ